MILTATVPAKRGRLRVVFEPVEEDGEVVSIGAIAEAWEYFNGLGWRRMPEESGALRISDEGLQPAILEAAEVAE